MLCCPAINLIIVVWRCDGWTCCTPSSSLLLYSEKGGSDRSTRISSKNYIFSQWTVLISIWVRSCSVFSSLLQVRLNGGEVGKYLDSHPLVWDVLCFVLGPCTLTGSKTKYTKHLTQVDGNRGTQSQIMLVSLDLLAGQSSALTLGVCCFKNTA